MENTAMPDNRIVWINGRLIPWEEATVHLMSHSIGRGSAIFEVVGFHDTDMGSAIFRMDEHIKRLFKTAELLSMELPFSPDDLYHAITSTVRRNNLREGFIKIIGYYPQIAFEILPPQKKLDLGIFVIGPGDEPVDLHCTTGTTLCISKWFKLDSRSVPIEAKVAANYLNGMMARMEARQRGYDFAVMLDANGCLTEGGTESIFLVNNHILMTPAPGTVLRSITRKSLLEVAKREGIETCEGKLHNGLLIDTDEIFLSGTPEKLLPVRQVEERTVENTPGPVTRRLSGVMDAILKGRDDRFTHWLFPVS